MSTYLQYYKNEICPKLEALDILLKTEIEPYSVNGVANILSISAKELNEILEKIKVKIITKGILFYLLQKLEPQFCTMLLREIEHKNTKSYSNLYSVEEISYIYLIDRKYIEKVAKTFGKNEFSYEELSLLFAKIGKE